jgi:lysozyme family protein
MKSNFEQCIAALLLHEGGFVNHPKDPGGMTNLGVTKTVWEGWTGHDTTEAAMRNLSTSDVEPLYRKKYWDAIQGDVLPSGVDYCVFDTAVNSGAGRAIKLLQRSIGVTQDGLIGPNSLAAILVSDVGSLIDKYCAARNEFLQSLSTFDTFGKGWTRRVSEVNLKAKEMI